jgi:hypothetical protein
MRYKLIKGGLLKKNKLPIFVIQKIGSNMSCLADSNKKNIYSQRKKYFLAQTIYFPKFGKYFPSFGI